MRIHQFELVLQPDEWAQYEYHSAPGISDDCDGLWLDKSFFSSDQSAPERLLLAVVWPPPSDAIDEADPAPGERQIALTFDRKEKHGTLQYQSAVSAGGRKWITGLYLNPRLFAGDHEQFIFVAVQWNTEL